MRRDSFHHRQRCAVVRPLGQLRLRRWPLGRRKHGSWRTRPYHLTTAQRPASILSDRVCPACPGVGVGGQDGGVLARTPRTQGDPAAGDRGPLPSPARRLPHHAGATAHGRCFAVPGRHFFYPETARTDRRWSANSAAIPTESRLLRNSAPRLAYTNASP